jgi:hypothetical protein
VHADDARRAQAVIKEHDKLAHDIANSLQATDRPPR